MFIFFISQTKKTNQKKVHRSWKIAPDVLAEFFSGWLRKVVPLRQKAPFQLKLVAINLKNSEYTAYFLNAGCGCVAAFLGLEIK